MSFDDQKQFRWGILGYGRIAVNFHESLKLVPNATLHAIASKSLKHKKQFQRKNENVIIYDNYEDLVQNPDIDVIYIATTQNFHYDHIKLALNHHKHVLCEKPFTLNFKQAEEVITLAKSNNLFLMEAMWTRFLPVMKEVQKILQSGQLGEIKQICAQFGFPKQDRPNNRLMNINLGGGVMLDMGIYPISFAQWIFKSFPVDIQSHAWINPNGVDGFSSYFLKYENGKSALLSGSIYFTLKEEAIIYGEHGFITIPIFHAGDRLYLSLNKDLQFQSNHHLEISLSGQPREYPYQYPGFQYEIEEAQNCIQEQKLESSIMPLKDTLEILKICDIIRNQWGLKYPTEI